MAHRPVPSRKSSEQSTGMLINSQLSVDVNEYQSNGDDQNHQSRVRINQSGALFHPVKLAHYRNLRRENRGYGRDGMTPLRRGQKRRRMQQIARSQQSHVDGVAPENLPDRKIVRAHSH